MGLIESEYFQPLTLRLVTLHMHLLSYWINRTANAQVRICSALLCVLGALMSLIIFLQVFFRFVIYVPFPWSEECARYMMVWMAMLGSVVALRWGRHIGVRILVEKIPGQGYDRFVVPLVQLCMIAFLVILAKQGLNLTIFNVHQRSPAMEIPMLIPYLSLPAGALMMILDIMADMFQDRFPTPAGSNANIATPALGADDANKPQQ
ncbi:MAG: TRAP transporter small permease [Desulfovermiculus sp.]|nr:TRAP transporter small permease [Desulfovermiculus sp.]